MAKDLEVIVEGKKVLILVDDKIADSKKFCNGLDVSKVEFIIQANKEGIKPSKIEGVCVTAYSNKEMYRLTNNFFGQKKNKRRPNKKHMFDYTSDAYATPACHVFQSSNTSTKPEKVQIEQQVEQSLNLVEELEKTITELVKQCQNDVTKLSEINRICSLASNGIKQDIMEKFNLVV